MKKIITLTLIAFTMFVSADAQVRMEVEGRIKIGEEQTAPQEGEIRFHNGDFQGYVIVDGNGQWCSLTTKMQRGCAGRIKINGIIFFADEEQDLDALTYFEECDCEDGLDNDGDGFIDCGDGDCTGGENDPVECDCEDGADNDGDGFIDCGDGDCNGGENDPVECDCEDGADNDGDGFVDCEDPDCVGIEGTGSIGSRLFYDFNRDGIDNNNDTGIPFTEVQLFREGDDYTSSNPVATVNSNIIPEGDYIFENLLACNYYIVIPNPHPGYAMSSVPTSTQDDDIDEDDNGIQQDINCDDFTEGPVVSPIITISKGEVNMTVDFGFIIPDESGTECDCEDGLDNDGDGDIDCEDSECEVGQGQPENSLCGCSDNIDNDGDNLTDCEDPDCLQWCQN